MQLETETLTSWLDEMAIYEPYPIKCKCWYDGGVICGNLWTDCEVCEVLDGE